MDDNTLLYHEQQVSSLCGLHCLNTLLQGPYFTEFDLAHLAQQLDKQEQQIAGTQLIPTGPNEESGNVRLDGMFSVQVLQMALETFGIQLIPIQNPRMEHALADPTTQTAFVCNLHEHWFTLREIDSKWWNFDSTKRAPEPLSSFYLSAFLGSLQEQGYMVFVVCGQELPRAGGFASISTNEVNGKYMKPSEAIAESKKGEQIRNGARIGGWGGDDGFEMIPDDFGATSAQVNDVITEDEDADLHRAIMESLTNTLQNQSSGQRQEVESQGEKEAQETFQEDLTNLLDNADIPKDLVLELAFRMPDGNKIVQKFSKEHRVQILKQFICQRLRVSLKQFELVRQFPREVIDLNQESVKLSEAGIQNREILTFSQKSS
eukprot:TRINITY_DN11278_c0_g1_i1.p2 TRINITY_DN11278_c0_g1~~TRINITY_DN11278_c0_g1_i1.p2  ORF type:complete len:392 (-),score=52.01 TRINITY_DN11278_c0_g1_i1:443-1570(-)